MPCLSDAPGHNVHGIQVKADEWTTPVAASYPNSAPKRERDQLRCHSNPAAHAKRDGYSHLTVNRLKAVND